MSDKLAYSIKEAAEALTISASLVKEEMYRGRIKYVKIGTRTVIPRWALEERLGGDPTKNAQAAVPVTWS